MNTPPDATTVQQPSHELPATRPEAPPDIWMSYRSGLVAHQVPSERRRLELQQQLMDPHSIALLQPSVTSTSRCLELGAGAGSMARWLADRCDGGHVTATDIDLDFLHDAAGPNLTVLEHDVVLDTFPPATFDLIHARALLVHLQQRDAVLAKVATWLAPGGQLVLEEPCTFTAATSVYPEFRCVMEAFRLGMEAKGVAVTDWARGLPRHLAECGLTDVRLEVTPQYIGHADLWQEYWQLFLNQVGPALVDTGLLTPGQLRAGLDLLGAPEFVDTPLAYIAAWGRAAGPHRGGVER